MKSQDFSQHSFIYSFNERAEVNGETNTSSKHLSRALEMIGGTSGDRPGLSSGGQKGALWNSIALQYTNKSTPIKEIQTKDNRKQQGKREQELMDPSPGRMARDDIT